MSTKKRYSYAGLSSILLFLAWPPFNWLSPLLLVALVPLFIALDDVAKSNEPKPTKSIFRLTFFTFFVFNVLSVYWIYNAINAYNTGFGGSIISLFVSLIPYALGPFLIASAYWVSYKLKQYFVRIIRVGIFISLVISAEYLQQSWDLAFPWMTLGNGFAGFHQLAQWYEYTGVYGGTVWILLSNLFLCWLIITIKTKQQLNYKKLIGGIAFIILPIIFSLIKYTNYKESINPSNVVVVQPNIDPYEKFGSLTAYDQLETLIKLSDSVAHSNTEYFIWPETALPNYADEDQIRNNREFIRAQNFLSKYKNGTLITGAETIKWYPNEATPSAKYIKDMGMYVDNFNSAVQIENSAEVDIYHKSKLVPGVEKLPFPTLFAFLKPVFAKLGGSVGGWGWQNEPSVFYAQSGIGTVPVICYESLWGNWIGQSVRNGAQFITIITNDGWWGNTSGKDQHLLYAKLRAIEMRRAVVRSANTGISAIIDQRGDITHHTEWWKREAINADINLNNEITFYAKNGDIIPGIGILFTFLGLIIGIFKHFKRKYSTH
ncbi:apolipoprotein N-acyltransferase [Pedobacter flavus]|uniref:Apolipoprotein N-acyltransferase n=1 Tax=Pedobacter flavus TaxID=3113906 RepID=A0ABU7H0T0_9SPHI|nr:apolipoprotein N-acyltransferase [Pedobacter sp. VNH31]MEE1884849.1 apolipoprotein N-acyltransferase [Pedobacter sp. VNH31]